METGYEAEAESIRNVRQKRKNRKKRAYKKVNDKEKNNIENNIKEENDKEVKNKEVNNKKVNNPQIVSKKMAPKESEKDSIVYGDGPVFKSNGKSHKKMRLHKGIKEIIKLKENNENKFKNTNRTAPELLRADKQQRLYAELLTRATMVGTYIEPNNSYRKINIMNNNEMKNPICETTNKIQYKKLQG